MLTRVASLLVALILGSAALAAAPSAPVAATAAPTAIPPVPKPLDFPRPKLLPPGRDFPITDFGAVPDGTTINTAAIQKAIDTCSAQGGGTVVVAKTAGGSVFRSGAILLKKGVHLRVDKDTTLKGSIDAADYPIVDSRFEGIERPFMCGFINANDVDGLTISGEGTIDGSGDTFGGGVARRARGAAPASAPATAPGRAPAPPAGGPPVAKPQTTFPPPQAVLTQTPDHPPEPAIGGPYRPRLVVFTNCTNCAVKDIHLQNQAVWCLHILYCTDFLVDNVNILDPTHSIPSSDGIDIDSSRRVRVNKTTISVNDDCISIKSGKDADGRRVNRASEDIIIENSHMAEGQGGVAMGSEVSGIVRNVEVRDVVVDSNNWAPIRFKSNVTRGGTVENIVYRNLKIDKVRSIFDFNLNWTRASSSGPRMPTVVRNVYVINVTGNANGGGAISGLPDSPITNILFQGCNLTANSAVRLSNTANLDTSGLKITLPNGGPAFTSTNTRAPAPATRPATAP